MAEALTVADRRFLAGPRLGFLTVAPATDGAWPVTRPVWFEVTAAGTVELFAEAASPKLQRITTTPRASLVAANAVGEPEHWVAVEGPARVEPAGALALAERLAARYWDLSMPDARAGLEYFRTVELMRIVLVPDAVRRYRG